LALPIKWVALRQWPGNGDIEPVIVYERLENITLQSTTRTRVGFYS
jgi:hypothetical protein